MLPCSSTAKFVLQVDELHQLLAAAAKLRGAVSDALARSLRRSSQPAAASIGFVGEGKGADLSAEQLASLPQCMHAIAEIGSGRAHESNDQLGLAISGMFVES